MKNKGDGRRKSRVEKEVQQVVSEYIIHQMKNDIPGLVTVTRVQMPADFRAAEIFVSYYDATAEQGQGPFDIIGLLQSWAKDMQDEISHKLQMRYCPKLRFSEDHATENILKIETILSNLSPNQKVLARDDIHDDDEES
jgi:ribosome-binding factor A